MRTAAESAARRARLGLIPALLACAALAACFTPRPGTEQAASPAAARYFVLDHAQQRQEIVLYALGLLGAGYRFGGRNPAAGLDCSGMVSYVVEQVSGLRLPHHAASIARQTRPIARGELTAGDLVFFNTQGRSHSHMGIYIGDGRFIHAPSSRGKVRLERLDNRYFAQRLDGLRTLAAKD
ncbi:MAG: C40 family peptidase [Azoarcus sp.]|jgi:cell wall-associated NlpC family hydrolase|nr:C40 family peptidase [Azoarcus sp.]